MVDSIQAARVASAEVSLQVATRVAVKQQDAVEQQGRAAIALLESAADIARTVSHPSASAGKLDVLA